jgi:hypothetical protein
VDDVVSVDEVAPVELPVELLSDWSPVVLLVELLSDWSPVVALVLLLSDWSPVDVVLSIVTLERPRRSIVGLIVEDDPVTEFCVLAVEPVTEEVELDDDPLIDGLTVLVPVVPVEGAAFAPALVVPEAAPESAPEVVPAVEAWSSGMQSMWTGLCECSFAAPVSFPASLPACGWPKVLQSGLLAVAVEVAPFVAAVLVAPFLPDVAEVVTGADFDFVSDTADLLVVWAKAGVAPITAAAMTLRVKGILFMKILQKVQETRHAFLGHDPRERVRHRARKRHGLTKA